MAVWRATHTHLYPGARLRASQAEAPGSALTIEFADLGTARARVEDRKGQWLLRVEPHRTQRGAQIAAKVWRVEPMPPPEPAGTWRVVRRAES